MIDATLKTETPNGTCWYRYVNDGYGEQEDSSAYDGIGINCPGLLTPNARIMRSRLATWQKPGIASVSEQFSNNGLLSEQIWDKEDMPRKELIHGNTAVQYAAGMGSCRTHKIGLFGKEQSVLICPGIPSSAYIKDKVKSSRVIWRADLPISVLPKGKILRIETVSPAVVKWTPDNWITVNDTETADMGLGIHFIDLPTDKMKKGQIQFTIFGKTAIVGMSRIIWWR